VGLITNRILSSPTGKAYSPLLFVCTTSRPFDTATFARTFSFLSRFPFLLTSSKTTPLADCCADASKAKRKTPLKKAIFKKLFFIILGGRYSELAVYSFMNKIFEINSSLVQLYHIFQSKRFKYFPILQWTKYDETL